MKEVIINNSLSIIRRYYPDYSEEKMAELKYGLLSIYLTVSKSIIIFGIAIILGVFKELLIFIIF
jgi:accessory gene regulator protein AgrB